ncbi:quinate utilization oxidoreductase QutH [Aspergillus steynii IBT 23096]|uniref:Quinate utilization oxidoreductase QutH n=1 Tax=Aspergillus steynii IBT 23096 TaxID=1392250 RepID=A0A2I2FSY0_9EURO|nr:quinate utilization oxidoreductase QutH [Aspergillus steynii IBT 23096]PLB43743.1 quinate utilization oxidoreductase QutH [Aspergillus steynii IBT 23096]
MSPINIIIVGAGLIGPRHAQSVLANPSTHLVGLIDPLPSAASIAQSLGTSYYPTIEACLQATRTTASSTPHAAIICTPNHTHVAVAQQLLSENLHILLEKPVSHDLPSGASLLRFSQQPSTSHLKILAGHHRRFNPYITTTKSIIDSGSLGTIIAINGLWTLFKPASYFEGSGSWRSSPSSGGVCAINLVHDIDCLQYLFGPIVRLHAEKTLPQRPTPPHSADEGAALTLRFGSGVVGTFLVCDATPAPWSFEAGTGENPSIPRTGGPGGDFYRILGSRASLSVPDMTRWSYDGRAKSWTEELVAEKVRVEGEEKRPFDLQLSHFVDVIGGRAQPRCSLVEGLRALVVVQAARRALETGETVDVGELEGELDSRCKYAVSDSRMNVVSLG